MPNPVRSALIWAASAFLIAPLQARALSLDASGQSRPEVAAPTMRSRLELTGEGLEGHTLRIFTEPGVIHRATGSVTREGRTWHASDAECPSFREQINAFQRLPSLQPGPVLLLPNASAIGPIAPRRIHGESWIFRTQLHAPDWSSMDAEMRAVSGPYADWASDTVRVIKSCDSPGD